MIQGACQPEQHVELRLGREFGRVELAQNCDPACKRLGRRLHLAKLPQPLSLQRPPERQYGRVRGFGVFALLKFLEAVAGRSKRRRGFVRLLAVHQKFAEA